MSDGETQRPPPVDKALLERFKADVKDRHGRIRGHYGSELEKAIKAYLDASHGGDTTDRLARIESELETIRGAVVESKEKKKKESRGSVTDRRLNKIRETIIDETANSPKAHEQVVEMAIREHAGSSAPTLRQYKQMLRQEKVLFPHPTKDSLYFRDATDYVKAVNAMAKGGKISQQSYDDILEQYGEDWWLNQQEDDEPTGFQ